MGLIKPENGWRLPNELWHQMEPLLPARKAHPLGCHNPRVSDRAAMNAIVFVLRTGAQWNSLNATGICSSSAAHRRFQEWVHAGVFEEFWRLGLLSLQALDGIDWSWLALDGAMTKAPLGGEKNRPQPYRSRQRRRQAQCVDRGERHPAGRGGGRGQPARYEASRGDTDRANGASAAADATWENLQKAFEFLTDFDMGGYRLNLRAKKYEQLRLIDLVTIRADGSISR